MSYKDSELGVRGDKIKEKENNKSFINTAFSIGVLTLAFGGVTIFGINFNEIYEAYPSIL
nr:hypothetical protein [uncultured Schaedlerella sp.]